MTGRSLAIGLAMLLLGFLLGVMWSRPTGPARAPRSPIQGSDGDKGAAARDSDHDLVPTLLPSLAAERNAGDTAAKAGSLGPDPGRHQAKIEIDFRAIPQDRWFRCLAVVEGPGLDGTKIRRAEKPYRGGRVTFTVPAGRWRVVWRTSFQLSDEHGRIMRLKADDHVLADRIRGIKRSSDEMRFDLVPPGEYEVAIRDGAEIVGAVTVPAGVETHFDVKE